MELRRLDEKTALGKLLVMIPMVAKDYGGRKIISDTTVEEAADFVLEKFSHLAAEEIREAYRRKAAGELDIQAEMWGGEFSVDQLGQVLTAYNEKRKREMAAYLVAIEEARQEETRKAKAERLRENFEADFLRALEEAKTKCKGWEDIPLFWFDSAKERKMFTWAPGEADAILAEARMLAAGIMADMEKRFQLQTISERWRNGGTEPATVEEMAKIIARRLSVWRKLVQDEK